MYIAFIGMTHVGGITRPQRFSLGGDRLLATKRAGRILRLWETQNAELWADYALQKAREISRGLDVSG